MQILDQTWKDHLLSLDHLRQGINLRAYAQRDPLNEYKREAFELFEGMLVELRQQVTSVLSHVELRVDAAAGAAALRRYLRSANRPLLEREEAMADAEAQLPARAPIRACARAREPHAAAWQWLCRGQWQWRCARTLW